MSYATHGFLNEAHELNCFLDNPFGCGERLNSRQLHKYTWLPSFLCRGRGRCPVRRVVPGSLILRVQTALSPRIPVQCLSPHSPFAPVARSHAPWRVMLGWIHGTSPGKPSSHGDFPQVSEQVPTDSPTEIFGTFLFDPSDRLKFLFPRCRRARIRTSHYMEQ